jgi:hypothetical protein
MCAMTRLGGRSRTLRVAACAIAVAALTTTLATPAAASENNQPSNAVTVAVGVPFTGNWPGTVRVHGVNSVNHWWRLPITVRPGDTVRLAVDNTGSTYTAYFCLLSPVDGFGADDALSDCSASYVSYGRLDRIEITYAGAPGQALLVAYANCGGCSPGGPEMGQYTATIERIVTKVNAGLVVPALIPPRFTVAAPMVYGDNSPVADGVGARLEWRYQPPPGRAPSPYAPLVDSYSAGGAATFDATLPAEAQGRAIQLRACAAQPGGDTAICTPDQKTVVQAAGPSPACVAARSLRSTRSRAVSKLKRKVRRAGTRRGRRIAKRKLRVAQRRLATAKRGVRSAC